LPDVNLDLGAGAVGPCDQIPRRGGPFAGSCCPNGGRTARPTAHPARRPPGRRPRARRGSPAAVAIP